MVTRIALLVCLALLPINVLAVPPKPAQTVTNEDIRDAILQVVKMVRSTEDKLERHEYRERVLGEQLKKAISTIDKRIKMLEPMKGAIGRLDERLAAVETILMQNDERERIQLQRTYDTVNDIQKHLPEIVENLKDEIIQKLSVPVPPAQIAEPPFLKKDLNKLQSDLVTKMDKINTNIDNMEKVLGQVREENKNIREIHNKSADNLDKVKRQLNTSEELLGKYENKLSEYNSKLPDFVPIDYKEQNDWHKEFTQSLDGQKSQLKHVLDDLKGITDKLDQLPNRTASDSSAASFNSSSIDEKLDKMQNDSNAKHEKVHKAIKDLSDVTETLTESFANSYDQIRKEIEELSKVEQVMIQTGDSVMDTKRRIEYGVHQILAEMSNQIKQSTKSVNQALNDRFNNFETSILDEDQGALANLTSKIGEEIDQVWRQIGIMHQQMSANADTLNKLQNQTDVYVNGSQDVMDKMKGKVGKITDRMTEVDENLNYLLGRLSLVTQHFNQIKAGLGTALDEIKDSFKTVQDKIKNNGPGPHPIPPDPVTT